MIYYISCWWLHFCALVTREQKCCRREPENFISIFLAISRKFSFEMKKMFWNDGIRFRAGKYVTSSHISTKISTTGIYLMDPLQWLSTTLLAPIHAVAQYSPAEFLRFSICILVILAWSVTAWCDLWKIWLNASENGPMTISSRRRTVHWSPPKWPFVPTNSLQPDSITWDFDTFLSISMYRSQWSDHDI